MDQSMAQPKRISEELYGIFYTLWNEHIITAKAGFDMWPEPYVDIFYHRRMDPETLLEETMLELKRFESARFSNKSTSFNRCGV